MRVDRCELLAGCYENATGLVAHQGLTIAAGCDQHAALTFLPDMTVPPFVQHRGYEVPDVGEVTVMIGTPFEGPDGAMTSRWRVYLPDGTGVQGDEWPECVAGDPAGALSAWLLLWMALPVAEESGDPVVSEAASRVMAYAKQQADRMQNDPVYVVTFDPRPIPGPGAIDGLKRMPYADAVRLVSDAAPRVGRIVDAVALSVV